MRRIAALLLAVGLAAAGYLQWMGSDAESHYTVLDPQPGVLPSVPGHFGGVTDTLAYDDNVAANVWACLQGGDGWGVKFTGPGDDAILAGSLIHFYSGWPSPGDTLALVKVFADDGLNGAPGTELWASDTVRIEMGAWNYVPMSVSTKGRNFYVFYVQVGNYPNCPGLSIDAHNNAPSRREWSFQDGRFWEDHKRGDWLIRAIVDWTPQDVNAASEYFAANMPADTLPGASLLVEGNIRNLGNSVLPSGTPVRFRAIGPDGYEYDDTTTTASGLSRGAAARTSFSPAWRIPNRPGMYHIQTWTEAVGEMWPANDTIIYDLSVARWIEYHLGPPPSLPTWAGPMRATRFDPAEFGIQYPVGIGRVRAGFYLHPSHPWPDSSFLFRIYGDDGAELLYESETLEAIPDAPSVYTACDLDSMVIIGSGKFWVAIQPVSSTGHPSTCVDSGAGVRSFFGEPGNWSPSTAGELYISAAVAGNVGIEDRYEPSVRSPSIVLANHPNPATDRAVLQWQVPRAMPVAVNLYDATGSWLKKLYSSNRARAGALILDTKPLAAGIYLVRLESPAGSAGRKLVISR